jgi:hypothetical protein
MRRAHAPTNVSASGQAHRSRHTDSRAKDRSHEQHFQPRRGSFTAHQALEWGAVAEVVPLGNVLPRAQELAEQMTQRPHLTNKYMAMVFRQRISRRLAEGILAGMALESVTAANLAYLQKG